MFLITKKKKNEIIYVSFLIFSKLCRIQRFILVLISVLFKISPWLFSPMPKSHKNTNENRRRSMQHKFQSRHVKCFFAASPGAHNAAFNGINVRKNVSLPPTKCSHPPSSAHFSAICHAPQCHLPLATCHPHLAARWHMCHGAKGKWKVESRRHQMDLGLSAHHVRMSCD